jgi:hypothetical protein
MAAVKARNLKDLRFPKMIPCYLKNNVKYTRASGFTVMLPILLRPGFVLSSNVYENAVRKDDLPILFSSG